MAKRPALAPAPAVLPPDLHDLLRDSGFRDPGAAHRRLFELFGDAAEMLALARVSGLLRDLLRECPDPDAAILHLSRFVQVRGSRLQLYRTFLDHPALLDRFVRVVSSSRYLADILVRNPDYLSLLSDATLLSRSRPGLREELRRVSTLSTSEETRLDSLRRIHRREMLRIGAADLLGFQELPEIARQVSDLADAFVAQGLSIVSGGRNRSGLVVLALGKWGGRELNYSSDIDLVFLASRPQATEVAQRLLRALSEPTAEGVVYRVDLRLRPYGAEGSLVSTPRLFETYLKTEAKPAERQMMLKARAAAGDLAAGRRFLKRLVPVLRKDAPSARRDVRRLKARIEKQLNERGQADGHVKLAPGGIRDVEFLVQALQLEAGIPGGNTLEALDQLRQAGLVGADDARVLRDAYAFLRTVEHRMQLMENQQVYRLPRKREDLERLGRTLGFRGPDSLLDAYDARTRRVRAIFDRILAPPGVRPDVDAAELLARIRRPEDVEVHARRSEKDRWTVTVAAAGQIGLLPLVAGLFAARRINVRSGDFLKPEGEGRRRKVLAVFDVSGVAGDPWDAFRKELAPLVRLVADGKAEAARDRIVDRVGDTLRTAAGSDDPLYPVRIETRNDPSAKETELHLHSTDAVGFLFEFSAALAALNLEIQRAAIRTLEDEVYDTFWVTDLQGRRIVDARALEQVRVAAALVRQFMHLLPRSPNPAQALRQFSALLQQMFARPDWVRELRNLESAPVLSTIARLMGVSRFLWEDFLLLQHENLFPVVCDVPALDRRRSRAQLEKELDRGRSGAEDPVDRLNEFKDREMFRIDLRHITRRSGFPEFMASLSDLADVVAARAVRLAERRLGPAPGRWSLGALGKFGGRELGLASDLDVILVHDGAKETGYFDDLVRALKETLRARREGSFAIDLRLRPYGDSGAPASSLEGFLAYYSEGGPAKQFERMSLVKLRPAAGDAALGARLLEARDAFVYSRRPLDYEDILHLRKRQAAELVPAGEVNAKYSPGGLVDVEYFVQARQIEAGRRDPAVRVPGTLEAIDRLVRGGHLRGELGSELSATYLFLRRLVDALRVVRGYAKDAVLPSPELREFAYLVRRLEYASPAPLEAEVRQRMSFARNLWNEVRFEGP